MSYSRFTTVLLVVILTAGLAACGGNNGSNTPVKPAAQQVAYSLQANDTSATIAEGNAPDYSSLEATMPAEICPGCFERNRGLSAAGVDPSLLPSLPPFQARPLASLNRSVSLVETSVDLSIAHSNENCAPAATLLLEAPADDVSWAIYEIPLGRYMEPVNLLINANQVDQGLWVGISNYARGSWTFEDEPLLFPGGVRTLAYDSISGYSNGSSTFVLLLTHDTGKGTITGLKLRTEEVIPAGLPGAWGEALNNAGLSSVTPGMGSVIASGLTYGSFAWNGYDDLQTMLPIYWSAWYGEPGNSYPEFQGVNAFPNYTRDLSDTLEDATSLQEIFLTAANQFPLDKRPTAQTSDPDLDDTNPLGAAIASFINATGSTADVPGINAACAPMPLDQQNALAEVVVAAQTAYVSRQTEIDNITTTFSFTDSDWENLFEYSHGGPTGLECLIAPTGAYAPVLYNSNSVWLRGWPYPAMLFDGSALLADAIDNLETYIETNNPAWENISLDFPSQGGQVTLGGTGGDIYTAPGDGNGHAILIDLGGNDTYNCHAGGTASIKNGVALCLDLSGDDIYSPLDDPTDGNRGTDTDDNTSQQGAGRYGIGILVDFAGYDDYYAIRMSQGSAVMGVGILADYAGNDIYSTEALAQGAAMGGVGLLWDRAGSDEYNGYSKAQGCGLMMGVGWLVDQGAGTDHYYMEPAQNVNKPEYYSVDYASNMSIGQGCGWGARWGWLPASNSGSTGTVGSGGFGLLFDGGGPDTYTCGTFGMGCGFYQGIGMLIDRGGDDIRNGHWYTNGATAHAAAAILWDASGNDQYSNNESIGIGGAHDWSLTWFIDRSGNDIYDAGGLGLGCGYSNALGYFLDLGGDDSYTAKAGGFQDTCLGKGNLGDANRPTMPSYGIMLDLNGSDTYDPMFLMMANSTGLPGNAASWVRTLEPNVGDPPADYTLGRGSGLDTSNN